MVRFQADKSEHLRHILLYEFNKGSKAAEASRNICSVYGESAITNRTAQRWFSQFEAENFNLTDAPRSGRPQTFDENRLNELIKENPNQSSRVLAKKMECNNATITRHLRSMRGNQFPSLRTPLSKYTTKTQSTSKTNKSILKLNSTDDSALPSSKLLQSLPNPEVNNEIGPSSNNDFSPVVDFDNISETLRYYPL